MDKIRQNMTNFIKTVKSAVDLTRIPQQGMIFIFSMGNNVAVFPPISCFAYTHTCKTCTHILHPYKLHKHITYLGCVLVGVVTISYTYTHTYVKQRDTHTHAKYTYISCTYTFKTHNHTKYKHTYKHTYILIKHTDELSLTTAEILMATIGFLAKSEG